LKKLTSILLLSILLFNVMGYYVAYVGASMQANHEMEYRMNNENMEMAEIFTIKIPASIPYLNNSTNYQRIDGHFEANGKIYQLYQQRFTNDTLEIMCVEDHAEQHLMANLSKFVTLSLSDLPQSQQKALKYISFFTSDYVPFATYQKGMPSFVDVHWIEHTYTYTTTLLSNIPLLHSPPPERA
jgi:hypothetical protein